MNHSMIALILRPKTANNIGNTAPICSPPSTLISSLLYIMKISTRTRLKMPNNKLTDEDKALFRKMMETVRPLKQSKKLPFTETKSEKPQIRTTPIISPSPSYYLSDHYSDEVASDSILSYSKSSIPHKRLSQLKTGKIPWQGRLDLHGLNSDVARDALCQFIDKQYNLGNRCVLIIHGKGGRHGEAPVLKNLVNHWLQQLPQILAFHSALPREGGSGAVYVLLQRNNKDMQL